MLAHLPPPPTFPLNPPPPHTHTKKKKKKKIFCQIRIPRQFIEKEPPRPIFFSVWIICQLDSMLVILFYKLTKNPIFFLRGGGGGGRGRGCGVWRNEHNVQMFKMAFLLLKENTCAKLFLNPLINVEVMALTSSIYNHFII